MEKQSNSFTNPCQKPQPQASNRVYKQNMSITEYQKMFRQTLKPEVVFAGYMLEDRGLRFGVDFGATNAIQKATELVIESLEEMDKWDRFGYGI